MVLGGRSVVLGQTGVWVVSFANEQTVISPPDSLPHTGGLHQRYQIRKADGSECDPRAMYFVLRLDEFGTDKGHIEACRMAAREYAMNAPPWMEGVAADLLRIIEGYEKEKNRGT